MLVLRRKVGEILVLSGGVEIEVIGITRSRVKLGIRAPKLVVVQRKEGLPIAEENQQASLLLRKFQDGERFLPASLLQTIRNKTAKTSILPADM